MDDYEIVVAVYNAFWPGERQYTADLCCEQDEEWPERYIAALGATPEGLAIATAPDCDYAFAQVFVKDRVKLDESMADLLTSNQEDAILWICSPKGGSGVKTDLNRNMLWKALNGKGIRPVSQVSIDKVWSAMRFRPHDRVGK